MERPVIFADFLCVDSVLGLGEWDPRAWSQPSVLLCRDIGLLSSELLPKDQGEEKGKGASLCAYCLLRAFT